MMAPSIMSTRYILIGLSVVILAVSVTPSLGAAVGLPDPKGASVFFDIMSVPTRISSKGVSNKLFVRSQPKRHFARTTARATGSATRTRACAPAHRPGTVRHARIVRLSEFSA